MIMDEYYLLLQDKLNSIVENDKATIDNQMKKLLDSLINHSDKMKNSTISDRIVSQYEEKKDNIVFGTVIEKSDICYLTYILIFEKDKVYSNILLKKFEKDKIIDAKKYFKKLKDMIINNNINKLSKLIIDKL